MDQFAEVYPPSQQAQGAGISEAEAAALERCARLKEELQEQEELVSKLAGALQEVGSQLERNDKDIASVRRMHQKLEKQNEELEAKNGELERAFGAFPTALQTAKPTEQTPLMGLAWLLLPFFPSTGISKAKMEVDNMMLDHKKRLSVQLFHAYDTDGSGELELEEFLAFMEDFDPRLRPEGAKTLFMALGSADGSITEEGFVRWVQVMFGELPDDVFREGMQELLDSAKDKGKTAAQKRARYGCYDQSSGGYI